MNNQDKLNWIKNQLDEAEKDNLSRYACLSKNAVRRIEEENILKGHRQSFSLDTDRILHSMAYSRYIDKTQVFYLVKNDHITHRVLHVQLVSKISRTIGRLLRFNEDLIEAIALGHDIGHAPFGHDGERFISKLSKEHGIGNFLHNLQSVRFLEKIEKKGRDGTLHCRCWTESCATTEKFIIKSSAPKEKKPLKKWKKRLQKNRITHLLIYCP